jgi:hypothetical protein
MTHHTLFFIAAFLFFQPCISMHHKNHFDEKYQTKLEDSYPPVQHQNHLILQTLSTMNSQIDHLSQKVENIEELLKCMNMHQYNICRLLEHMYSLELQKYQEEHPQNFVTPVSSTIEKPKPSKLPTKER